MPITLLRRNGSGSASELSTCVSAAKCTTASASPTNWETSSASVMSPWTSRTLSSRRRQGLTAAGIRHRVEHRQRRVGVFAHRAVYEVGADETGAAGDQQSHAKP